LNTSGKHDALSRQREVQRWAVRGVSGARDVFWSGKRNRAQSLPTGRACLEPKYVYFQSVWSAYTSALSRGIL